MDTEDDLAVENEDQFWTKLQHVSSTECDTHEAIDDVLRSYLHISASVKDDFLHTDYDFARCCYELLRSRTFAENPDYVRRQFIYGILQEDEAPTLHIMTAVLLFDGRSNEETFQMMQEEGVFARLLELIKSPEFDGTNLHKMLLELMCEMSRIQQLSLHDIEMVDDSFILYLFQRIEELSDDASDPYHSAIIRVLLVLNEQYMCFAQDSDSKDDSEHKTPTNRIIKMLSAHGPTYRTFGENLILLLNRENALGPQLLLLKLLYLLFTTPATFEYFYTNDLHVLVDVIIRNLLDLDPGFDDDMDAIRTTEGSGQKALRHTYLRVLHPLLRNTQLSHEDSHYKREDLRRLLHILVNKSSLHFAPVDATIVRLVTRCRQIEWIRDESDEPTPAEKQAAMRSPPSDADIAKKLLGMNMTEAGESKLSIIDVAAKVEKEERQRPAPPPRRRNKRLGVPMEQSKSSDGSLQIPPSTPRGSTPDTGTPLERSPFSDDEM